MSLGLIIVPAQADKGKLLPGTIIIDVSYQAISCECAQWLENRIICDTCVKEYIFLEPADEHLINADKLWNGNNIPLTVKLTGQYYSGIGFPRNYKANKGVPDPARVFRYTQIEVISK